MPKISIKEQSHEPELDSFAISVTFDESDQFDGIAVRNPLTPRNRAKLEWHFEQYVSLPYLKEVEPREAETIIKVEGEDLFAQILGGVKINKRFHQAMGSGLDNLVIEISGSPEFHSLHWEALKDPSLPRPFALDALILRKDDRPQAWPAEIRETTVINLLIVTARPRGRRDVGYRTISRPLVELLRNAQLPVKVHILRPATYESLVKHLGEAGSGFYQVVHFDVHGALLTFDDFERFEKMEPSSRLTFQASRYGRPMIRAYDGRDAFLFFDVYREPESDGDDGFRPDPVRADELADLLVTHGIPLVILNACQSAKELGGQGKTDGLPIVEETSLASRLMRAGAQTVLAMAYSVTVTAAERLMKCLYQELFRGRTLPQAVLAGRKELANDKFRLAAFNRQVRLEDWLLPVIYQKQAVDLKTRKLTDDEEEALLLARLEIGQMPDIEYGFHGRDIDVLNIERRVLLTNNILLLRGMGGAGKTTLLLHLAWWWQTTDFIKKVFYFGYDQKAFTRQEIVFRIAESLYSKFELTSFQAMGERAQIEKLARKMRNERHLLILDNLESIQGEYFAVKNTLAPGEQTKLIEFLAQLRQRDAVPVRPEMSESTIVLLGSRGGEAWLAAGTFGENLYDLGGLDREAATQFADEILRRNGAAKYRGDVELGKLLKLLSGFPLPLKVVLENLKRQTPAEVLAALRGGDVDLNTGTAAEKTSDILKCVEYSHSNISTEKQELLRCLAPFTVVVNRLYFDRYVEALKKQAALAHLKHALWDEVFAESVERGLMSRPSELPVFNLQPILPYFLRTEDQDAGRNDFREAVKDAFREYYQGLSHLIQQLMISKDPQEKQAGRFLANLEFENVETCIRLSLEARASVVYPYAMMTAYYDTVQNNEAGLRLGEWVLKVAEDYPAEILAGELGRDVIAVLDDMARRQYRLKRFAEAEDSYQKELEMLLTRLVADPQLTRRVIGGVYHQLGMVAQAQRQFWKAEGYYQRSLKIKAEDNDHYAQAITLHQLGSVAQEQRDWPKAEDYYQRVLEIWDESKDRQSHASTLHQLGLVAQEQRDWPKAERYYQQAVDIYVEFNGRYEQGGTLHQLGVIAEEQREWLKAEDYFQQALNIFVEFNDRHSQAGTLHQLGTVAYAQRDWPKAEGYYQQALEIFVEFNDRYAQSGTLHQLGILAHEQHEWPKAEGFYEQALKIKLEFNSRYDQANTLHQLGTVAQVRSDWPKAERYYQQALEIFVEFNDRYAQASTLHQLGTVSQEREHFEEAERYYEQALEIFDCYGDSYSEAGTVYQLGVVSKLRENIPLAKQHYLRALKLFCDFKDDHGMGIVLGGIAALVNETHDPSILKDASKVLGISLIETNSIISEGKP